METQAVDEYTFSDSSEPEVEEPIVAKFCAENENFYLRDGENTIGRSEENSVVIDMDTVSNFHAVLRINIERKTFMLQDKKVTSLAQLNYETIKVNCLI